MQNRVSLSFHPVFFVLLLFLGACSSKPKINETPKVKSDVEPLKKNEGVQSNRFDSKTFGPTRKFSHDNFQDKTKEYGLQGERSWRNSVVDFDNDGADDLITMEEAYGLATFWRFNAGTKRFVKLSYNPFPEMLRASYFLFVDVDKDQVPDVFAVTLNQKTELPTMPVRVFKGEVKLGKIHYREIRDALKDSKGLPIASLSLVDYDLDGHLDIFLANWVSESEGKNKAVTDRLYRGQGFVFNNVTDILENELLEKDGTQPNAVPSFGSSTCDLDQNGFPDILVAANSGHSNKLWMNLKTNGASSLTERQFRDMAKIAEADQDKEGKLALSGGGHTQFMLCADYNNDGIMDISVGEIAHYYDSPMRDRSAILTGASLDFPPRYLRTEYHSVHHLENWNQSDRRGVWFDYNADGLLDLVVENSGHPPDTRLILFEQEKDHSYSDVAENLGINIMNPSSVVKGDFNRDGMIDIVVGQNNVRLGALPARIYLFENTSKRHGRRTMSFFLQGEKSNGPGIGAMVIVKTPTRTMRQWHEFSYGPLNSQNFAEVHFGLGEEYPEQVEVRWPVIIKSAGGQEYPLTRKYNLSDFKFHDHQEVTLCENGRFKSGRHPQHCK